MHKIILLSGICLLLTGCGQSGALYLPPVTPTSAAKPPVATPAATPPPAPLKITPVTTAQS